MTTLLRPSLKACQISSPVGPLTLRISEVGLAAIDFSPSPDPQLRSPEAPLECLVSERLSAYFGGEPVDFEGIPLDLSQGTPFQQAVWNALRTIPFGEVRSYAWVSQLVNCPKGVRAVGQANRRNPIPIIVPCHRVITKSRALGGYMGDSATGQSIKAALLEREGLVLKEGRVHP
jgi:methylated-DNA-[protein]-cysteine S-methyltransferase